jgi:hypothetical protein
MVCEDKDAGILRRSATNACQLEATVQGKTHLIEFDSGTSISAGQLKVTWTRLDGGGSRIFAIAGPTFTLKDGTVMGDR